MNDPHVPDTRWRHAVLIGGIVLIGLNLRPAITAISPLAERMHEDGLGRGVIGSLTTVPLVFFGLASVTAGWLGRSMGFARALGLGLLVLGLGCFIRSGTGDLVAVWRYLGTMLVGVGIALGNVLLPSLAKSRYPRHLGPVTSLYSTAMNLGAAAGIAFAVPLADALGSWNGSLAAWGAFALLVLAIWAPQMRPRPAVRPPVHPLAGIRSLACNARAWQVTVHMGLQSVVFYSAVAWLPSLLQHRGMSEGQAAAWVTGQQVIGCVASLVLPTLAGRRRSQSGWVMFCFACMLAGLTGTLLLPLSLAGTAVLVLGIGLNAGFGMVLLLIALRSRTPETAANLSSMAQSFGYLLAAPGPFLVGWISAHGGWELGFSAIIAVTAVAAVPAYLAGREGEVDPPAVGE